MELLKNIEPILKENDVEFAGLFGSYARGEEKSGSDIDILIRFKEPKGLFEFVGLERKLSEVLHRKVDLVTESGLCRHIKDNVLKDLQPIYGRK